MGIYTRVGYPLAGIEHEGEAPSALPEAHIVGRGLTWRVYDVSTFLINTSTPHHTALGRTDIDRQRRIISHAKKEL
jgi:hypothetical protein